ncbi:hypothetical protein LXL04_012279 [Taraxacum kok-saghyz]
MKVVPEIPEALCDSVKMGPLKLINLKNKNNKAVENIVTVEVEALEGDGNLGFYARMALEYREYGLTQAASGLNEYDNIDFKSFADMNCGGPITSDIPLHEKELMGDNIPPPPPPNSNNFSLLSMLSREKLNGSNFLDWSQALRIALSLRNEKKEDVKNWEKIRLKTVKKKPEIGRRVFEEMPDRHSSDTPGRDPQSSRQHTITARTPSAHPDHSSAMLGQTQVAIRSYPDTIGSHRATSRTRLVATTIARAPPMHTRCST